MTHVSPRQQPHLATSAQMLYSRMATSRYELRSRKTKQVPRLGRKETPAVTAPSAVEQNVVPTPVVQPVASREATPLPMSPRPLGSWEHVSSHPQTACSSKCSDTNTSSSLSSVPRSSQDQVSNNLVNHILPPNPPSSPSTSIKDSARSEIEDSDTSVFAIHPLDEPNEDLSPEQLEAVSQAIDNLTEEQRDSFIHRSADPSSNTITETSKDKGKGVDPHNHWGNAGIPADELDSDTQETLMRDTKASKSKTKLKRKGSPSKEKEHRKHSKAKEREHRKKSKKSKKIKEKKASEKKRVTHEVSFAPTDNSDGISNQSVAFGTPVKVPRPLKTLVAHTLMTI
ncbi:hypothetical protein NP233_g8650 [Leucocoprinus birnbaumii]|uniref:Uncharacterized protein n=1 Tax=Leucocoprinus birnbaumii TaxID=56174 RepID=A0AAD5YNW0_9AGAR|nr:hypothetical protein NP233_g8650 [Leucocoprinus birnbaumii]